MPVLNEYGVVPDLDDTDPDGTTTPEEPVGPEDGADPDEIG